MSKAQWSSHLVITLKRGMPGKRQDHRAVVKSLGLRKRESVVEQENTPTIRGMITKVKRLLQVETKEMYSERLAAEAARKSLRPPLAVHHARPAQQQSGQ